MSNGARECNEDANCKQENLEQSSDAQQAIDDKRKEELYSDGGGRKTDFGEEDTTPPHATENESKK
ncbi:MAG TPA: hypothetical protein EYN91_23690 [Candidatus Melainabacteria bacterium]|mgnify:CR=1 FL=1|nr:hypothetical protein [Candidatus Melainabacteria bacterium]HIN65148.1 hypothetical protein [Candidatus Obscuribacterales bacterium]